MKFLVVLALFAFVAVKLNSAAPVPEEEKKEEVASVSKVAEEVTTAVTAVTEVKSSPEVSPEAPVAVAAETPAPAA